MKGYESGILIGVGWGMKGGRVGLGGGSRAVPMIAAGRGLSGECSPAVGAATAPAKWKPDVVCRKKIN